MLFRNQPAGDRRRLRRQQQADRAGRQGRGPGHARLPQLRGGRHARQLGGEVQHGVRRRRLPAARPTVLLNGEYDLPEDRATTISAAEAQEDGSPRPTRARSRARSAATPIGRAPWPRRALRRGPLARSCRAALPYVAARQGSVDLAMEPCLHSQPVDRRDPSRPAPAARLRVLHHHRCLRRRLVRQQALGRPRRQGRHRRRHRRLGRALRPGRRPALPRDHRLPAVLQRGSRTGSTPSRSGRAASASGAPSRSAPSAPGSAAAAGASRCPAWADAARPRHRPRPGDRPLGQLVQPGAVRQADRPALGAGDHARARTASTGTYHPTFLYESLWCVGVALLVIWADRRFKLGPRPGLRAVRRRATAWAAPGSSTCASTRRTTCWASGSTCGPRSSSSLLAVATS